MSFNEIMEKITSGLTGQKDHDAAYLMEQCEQYKSHEMAKEIIDFQHNSPEELEQLGQQFGFPTEPDNDVIGLAYAYGKHFLEQNSIDGARYCFQIVYGLTKDERIKYLIEKLPEVQN